MTFKKIYCMIYKLMYSNKLRRRRKILACLAFGAAFVVGTVVILNNYLNPDLYFLYWGPWENTSCHYIETDATLPRADAIDFNPPAKSIFFHETSCSGALNSRQACSAESAARANPDWQINVLFAAPVTHYALKTGAISVIKNLTNIKLTRVHIGKYAKGTPLQSMVSGGALNRTRWRISHSSDVLRYLSLYKFGGVYLDLDVVVVKSFDSLESNWGARAADIWVEAGAISFSRDRIGRELADAAIT